MATKQLGNNKERVRCGIGQVDLLIGIDHPQLHTGSTRQNGDLVARNTPLGWVIFGGKRETQGSNRMYMATMPAQVDLTDFWQTENKVSPRVCESGKLTQEERE